MLSPLAAQIVQNGWVAEGVMAPIDADVAEQNGNLLTTLNQKGLITFSQAHQAYANANGFRYAELEGFRPHLESLRALPAEFARRVKVIPFEVSDDRIIFATTNPTDPTISNEIKQLFPDKVIALAYAPLDSIQRLIDQHYSAMQEARSVGADFEDDRPMQDEDTNLGSLGGGEEDAVVRILGLLVEQAVRDRASDIHIEPNQGGFDVRFRIDGDLVRVDGHDSTIGTRLVKLVKVNAKMKHSTSLVPESNGWRYTLANRSHVDFRVEASPVAWGEEVVLRLQESTTRAMSELGFSPYNLERYERAYTQPYGMILATGPTGSGKSTTEYSTLAALRDETRKIVTMENPVEIKMASGVSQTAINNDQGLTFASGLRSILRRDPDIILLGEIRDTETAQIAVDAALTGHLMLSTLHTNDAPGAVGRMRELGIEPFLLAESLLTVVAQRLVKRLCPACKVPLALSESAAADLGFGALPEERTFFAQNPAGCEACAGRGTRGRMPIHEVMYVDADLRNLISEGASQKLIAEQARLGGMTSLRQDGLEKAAQGLVDPIHLSTRVSRDR